MIFYQIFNSNQIANHFFWKMTVILKASTWYKKWEPYLNLAKCDDLGPVKCEQVKCGKKLTLNVTLRLTAVNFE